MRCSDRRGLVKRARQRRRCKAEGTLLSSVVAANDLWCADFKGELSSAMAATVTSLTVTDQATRYAARLRSPRIDEGDAGDRGPFLRLFQGVTASPNAIRSDNGLPFASPNGLYNLSKLSVFWLSSAFRDRAHQARQSAAKWFVTSAMHRTLEAGNDATARVVGMPCQQQDRFEPVRQRIQRRKRILMKHSTLEDAGGNSTPTLVATL